jgi:hypothetical protein
LKDCIVVIEENDAALLKMNYSVDQTIFKVCSEPRPFRSAVFNTFHIARKRYSEVC